MKKNKWNYLIIVVYGLILTAFLLGFNKLYGSNVDWISQHSVIPEYFRNIFYETKNLVPNFAFGMGAGQNIYNYSYYGLLSPVILFSYLLPFVNMTTYIIIASIVLYIFTGILLYYYLDKNKYDKKISLYLSLTLLTISSLTYHFHHHIMFVWYMPFLILGLIGVDRYINENKSFLLILSVFLIIITNYYYSVPAIIVVLIYGVYKLLDKDFELKTFVIDILKASVRIMISILLAGIVLIPVFYVIINTSRGGSSNIAIKSLLIPNLDEIMYKSFSMGLVGLLVLSPFGLLCENKKNKKDIFLSICLLVITFMPIFMYLLNGCLYVRGKSLIPFIVLYIINFGLFFNNLKNKNINIKKFIYIVFGLIIVSICLKFKVKLAFIVDIVLSLGIVLIFNKYKKAEIIFIPLIIILLTTSFVNNKIEDYVSVSKYKNINDSNIEELIKSIPNDNYRTNIYDFPLELINKSYNGNYYGVGIYSSSYNSLYWDFYHNKIGNNIFNRNVLVTNGAKNVLFNKLMGVKYIVSSDEVGIGYEKVATSGKYSLYVNNNVDSIIYQTKLIGNSKQYQELEYPYNIEYMMNYGVSNNGQVVKYDSKIKKLKLEKNSYEFDIDEDKEFEYKIDKINNKLLIISFDMDYNQSCSLGDVSITINNVKNKLTCKEWLYHNKNYKFQYVISDKEIENLKIKITKGKYDISNIEAYTMDYNFDIKNGVDFNIDKAKSVINFKSSENSDTYVITSFPYDKGFKVYVDDKEIDTEIINSAFLGFMVPGGEHNITIKYTSLGFIYGLIVSIFGIIALFSLIIYEKYQNKINKILLKNKEVIMYLIFGVLTTIVSIGTYYIVTKTLLNPNNKIQLQIANVISWIVSVTFAYITNRKYVFTSKNKNVLREGISFYSSRIVTLLVDMVLMFVLVSCLKYNDKVIKVLVQFIVIVANYILSKLLVFKKEK